MNWRSVSGVAVRCPSCRIRRWRRAIRWLLGKVSPGTEYFPDRMATPKAQFSFGWDFAPRLLSTGIWDDIRLVVTRGAYIEDLWVQAEPVIGSRGEEEKGSRGEEARGRERERVTVPARFQVRLRGRCWQAGALRAEVTIAPEGFPAPSVQETLDLDLNLNLSLNLSLDLPSARLWWPWDQGEPNLYRVTVRLLDDTGVLDEASQVVGVRTVTRSAFPDGGKWRWLINGRPVFLRGANWVPADVLPGRVTEDDYARLLGMARDAGINFLRVWGGGVREKRAFWDHCDRLGIMAWQEFPLACAFLDHYPRDRAYLDTLAAEARGTVQALRNHPSLIAWCGGNEISPRRERLPLGCACGGPCGRRPGAAVDPGVTLRWRSASLAGMARFCALDRSGWPGCAIHERVRLAGVARCGDRGRDVPRWRAGHTGRSALGRAQGPDRQAAPLCGSGCRPFDRLRARPCRGHRGHAARPGDSVAGRDRGMPAAARDAVRVRRATGRPSHRRDAESAENRLCVFLRPPRLCGEHPRCGGVAFWQLNEPWPAVSWSVIDRGGRPKAAYEMLRRAYQPILIAARFPWRRYAEGDVFRAEVWLVNDGPAAWQGCCAEALLDDTVVWTAADVSLPPAC